MVPVQIKHTSVNTVITNTLYLVLIITDRSRGGRGTIYFFQNEEIFIKLD